MKTTVLKRCEIEINTVRIVVPVRYGEEQIPNNFPRRSGDLWEAFIDIDSGEIAGWPRGVSGRLSLKVCDEGVYTLLDEEGLLVAERHQDYVPHGVVPGRYGDYIDLDIDHDGVIRNWPDEPDVASFFPTEED